MTSKKPASGTYLVIGILAVAALVAVGLVTFRNRYKLPTPPPEPVPAPMTPTAPPPTTPADAATESLVVAWHGALARDDWQAANTLEDQLVARGDAALPTLRTILDQPAQTPENIVAHQRLAAVLGRIGSPAAVTTLVTLAAQPRPDAVTGQVLLALADTPPQFEAQVTPLLIKAMETPTTPADTRSSCAVLLARRGDPAALGRLTMLALNPPAGDSDLGLYAIAALGAAPSKEPSPITTGVNPAGQVLTGILATDPEAKRRMTAARALQNRPAANLTAALIQAAETDQAATVRIAAIQSLADRPTDSAAMDAIAARLATDTEPGVRAVAAQALGQPGATANLARLQPGLQADAPVSVQLKIVESIEKIGGPEAIQLLQMLAPPASPAPAPQAGPAQPALPLVVRQAITAARHRLQPELPPAPPPPAVTPPPADDF